MAVHINNVGLTKEELMLLISPIRNEDGSVSHESPISINNEKLIQVIKQSGLNKKDKMRLHFITVRMVDTINELGMHKYYPDKFKPILPALFAMAMMNDGDFIGRLQ